MGTNYYALKHPDKDLKEALHKAIDEDDYNEIKRLYQKGYEELQYFDGEFQGNEIHLGKRSVGWKFLWDPNMYLYYKNGYEKNVKYLYQLNKDSIHKFIFRDDITIVDEYDEVQNKEEFWDMALNWNQPDGWDSDSYNAWERQRNPNYIPHIYNIELANYLSILGYKLSKSRADFYSDGLRFATNINFS